jgi:FKBP-type peptidyl-prolyl cis-trans isomerase
MMIGSNLRSAPLEFDYNAFADGVRAMVEGKETQFTEQEAVEIIETAYTAAMEKIATENRLQEELFLAQNAERADVQVTPNGLQYEIIEETDGEKPQSDSVVRVKYEGLFRDGSLFDSTGDDEEGAFIPLEMVIPGWTEGLTMMSVGSKYRFFIPSSLAYGEDGIQSVIPPYATLIFTVELLEILKDEGADFRSQFGFDDEEYEPEEE